MDPHLRMEYLLGRAIAISLPTQTSRLEPTVGDLKLIAQRLGLGIDQARRALAVFNAYEKNLSRSEQWRTLLHSKAETLDEANECRADSNKARG